MKAVAFGRVMILAAAVSLGLGGCAATPEVKQTEQLPLEGQVKIKAAPQSSDQGDPEDQFVVGTAYFSGKGVPQDYKQAADWFLKAAKQGHVKAQGMLGLAYKFGTGVPQDYKQAADWFLKAAEQGNANAQFELASIYYAGTPCCGCCSKPRLKGINAGKP